MEKRKDGYRWVVLGTLSLISFLVGVSIYVLPPLFSEISQEFQLTKAQMGAVMGSIPIASIFLALIGGMISDRIGSKWSYGLAVLLIGVAGILRGFSENAAMLIFCMAVIGAGDAVMFPNIPKALGSWFESHELGLANGITMAAFGISGAVGMGISASILSPLLGGWRNALFPFSFIVVLAGIGWILFFKDNDAAKQSKSDGRQLWENVRRVTKVRDLWVLALFSGLVNFSLLSVLALLPVTLFERGAGSNAGALVSILMGMAFIFNIIGGIFSDRVGKRKPFLITGTILFGLCTMVFGFADGVLLVIALVFGGAGIGIVTPISMLVPVEMEEIGPSLAATAYGVIMSIGCVGGVVGPFISGLMMDIYKAHWPGFFVSGAVIVMAGIAIVTIRETGQKKHTGE